MCAKFLCSSLFFMLFSSLKRNRTGDDDDDDDGDGDDEDEDDNGKVVPGYGHYITRLCCFPEVSP